MGAPVPSNATQGGGCLESRPRFKRVQTAEARGPKSRGGGLSQSQNVPPGRFQKKVATTKMAATLKIASNVLTAAPISPWSAANL